MGKPDFMICMDSGCIDYNTLWITTSLRGISKVDLTVEVLKESVHSGTGSGIAPDSFSIMRHLLDRLEDSKTSKVTDALQVQIPDYRVEDAKKLAEYQKEKSVTEAVKLSEGVKPLNDDYAEVILNNTWRPMMTVVGMTGFPPAEGAGNVLRAKTKCRISMRLPPTCDSKKASEIMCEILSKDKPYNAKITAEPIHGGNGFASKNFSDKVKNSFNASSQKLFGKDFYCFGEGGSIPFISELGQQYPECEIFVTGILGPNTNAHCPNEALNIKYTESMTVALAHLINDYCL
jgi:acetylornithine deacetylase/succinyl-diaminopimelate desuccinylase-like protein